MIVRKPVRLQHFKLTESTVSLKTHRKETGNPQVIPGKDKSESIPIQNTKKSEENDKREEVVQVPKNKTEKRNLTNKSKTRFRTTK